MSLPMCLSPSKQTATANQAPTAAVTLRQIDTATGQPRGTKRQWQALQDRNNRPNCGEHKLSLNPTSSELIWSICVSTYSCFFYFILSLTLQYQLLCYPLVFRLLTDYVLITSQLSTSRRGFKKKKSSSLGIYDYFCCVVKSTKAIWFYINWLQFHQ